MELVEIKNRIQNAVENLPPDKLEIVLEFLEDLQKAGEWDEWDHQIAKDLDKGDLDFLIQEADEALHDKDIELWP